MNLENKKLNAFATIYKNLQETEAAYIELEEFGVEYIFTEYFNANLHLSDELEKTIDYYQLTPHKRLKYQEIMEGIYSRLKWDYPQLYSIGSNIDEIFYAAFQAAEQAIEERFKRRTFYACGVSSLTISLPEHTLLGVMLKDKLFTPENFTYSNGFIGLNTIELNKKFDLTGQEYELYEAAYLACLNVLREKLKLEGSVEADIR